MLISKDFFYIFYINEYKEYKEQIIRQKQLYQNQKRKFDDIQNYSALVVENKFNWKKKLEQGY